MAHTITANPGNNITLVYKALPLGPVDRNALRAALGGDNIVAMDTPELLVMFNPAENRVLQLGDRRLRAVDQGNRSPDQTNLPFTTTTAHKAVKSDALEAYGFNYDLIIKWQGSQSANDFLQGHYLRDAQQLDQVLDGKLTAYVPRFQFERDGKRYDLLIEPKSDHEFSAHLNVHYEASKLPNQNRLRTAFLGEYDALILLLARFLEE